MQSDETKPPMKFRKLRIAWSVFWGLACVLLVVLWVRSYWRQDTVTMPHTEHASFQFASLLGYLSITTRNFPEFGIGIYHSPVSFRDDWLKDESGNPVSGWWIRKLHFTFSKELIVPYWMPTVAILAVAGISWMRWRFSLRTLLIATTLVAVVLGLVAYMANS